MNIFALDKFSHTFPDPSAACDEGILAYGGDLNPNRILKAYMKGIFPWYNKNDPILWWSPNPRMVLSLDEFKCSKSLKRTVQKKIFEIKFNSAFEEVMKQCAKVSRKGQKDTWILPQIIEAYGILHNMGFAHSFEAYYEGKLVGGGYGIAMGDIFTGESMFALKNDASKVAFYHLVKHLKQKGFSLIDCQISTAHLKSLGAKEISREAFLSLIQIALQKPRTF
jgi:leucyl/phenylalanyl-tRNA--protein transferase